MQQNWEICVAGTSMPQFIVTIPSILRPLRASCGTFEDAGVVCQGNVVCAFSGYIVLLQIRFICSIFNQPLPPLLFLTTPTDISTQPANCTTTDVRLVGTESENTRQGRVELCINNAWGSVCDDGFFDNTDAGVICQQIGGFTREGMYSILFLNRDKS